MADRPQSTPVERALLERCANLERLVYDMALLVKTVLECCDDEEMPEEAALGVCLMERVKMAMGGPGGRQ